MIVASRILFLLKNDAWGSFGIYASFFES